MLRLLVCVTVLLKVCPAEAEPASNSDHIQEFIDSTAALSSEVRSDILLRLCASDLVPRLQRVSLAVQAFNLADGAQYRMALRTASGGNADSEGALDERAFSLKLDQLSLKTRAIQVLLNIAPEKAIDLFEQIPPASGGRTRCSDPLVPDATEYYTVLGHILASKAGLHLTSNAVLQLLQSAIRQDPAISDIVGLLRIMKVGGISREDTATLLGYLESELSRVEPDPAAFRLLYPDLKYLFEDAISAARSNRTSNEALLDSIRTFLINENQTVCISSSDRKPLMKTIQGISDYYNLRLERQRYPSPPDHELKATDLTPEKVENFTSLETIWRYPDSGTVYSSVLRALDVANGSTSRDAKANSTNDAVTTLEDWKSETLSKEAFFHAKGILYITLLSAAPEGTPRLRVLSSWTEFLEEKATEEPVVIWVYWATELLSRAAKVGQPVVTKNPTVVAYQRLSELLGKTKIG